MKALWCRGRGGLCQCTYVDMDTHMCMIWHDKRDMLDLSRRLCNTTYLPTCRHIIHLLCNAYIFWSQILGSTSFNKRRHQNRDSLLGLVQQPPAPLLLRPSADPVETGPKPDTSLSMRLTEQLWKHCWCQQFLLWRQWIWLVDLHGLPVWKADPWQRIPVTKLSAAPLWSLVIRWFADVVAYAPIREQTLPLRLTLTDLLQYPSNSSLQQVCLTKPLVSPCWKCESRNSWVQTPHIEKGQSNWKPNYRWCLQLCHSLFLETSSSVPVSKAVQLWMTCPAQV